MKNLVKYILETQKKADSWNGKFYTTKEKVTSIYLDDEKYDVTEMYESTRKEDGYVYASEIADLYTEKSGEIIELEMDLEFEDITNEEFEAKKQEIINTLN